jgi:hypothetical protein
MGGWRGPSRPVLSGRWHRAQLRARGGTRPTSPAKIERGRAYRSRARIGHTEPVSAVQGRSRPDSGDSDRWRRSRLSWLVSRGSGTWRRARDSNPRERVGYRPSGFQDRRHRPLGQPSHLRKRSSEQPPGSDPAHRAPTGSGPWAGGLQLRTTVRPVADRPDPVVARPPRRDQPAGRRRPGRQEARSPGAGLCNPCRPVGRWVTASPVIGSPGRLSAPASRGTGRA